MMAVQLPILAITSALKALELQANSSAHSRSVSANIIHNENATELARLRIESRSLATTQRYQMMDRHHQREILDRQHARELQDRQHQRQADTLLKLADISAGMLQSKIDAVLSIFSDVKDILVTHQDALIREKDRLNEDSLTGSKDPADFVLRMKRQKEVDRALQEITDASMQLAKTAMAITAHLDPNDPTYTVKLQNLKNAI